MPAKIELPNPANTLKRYLAGESINKLSKELGISRPVISRFLRQRGASIRGAHEQQRMSLVHIPREERRRWTLAAHAAVRGKRQAKEHRLKIAATRERDGIGIARLEVILADLLRERGWTVIPQKAICQYNVDMAFAEAPVAVEVFGGQWHTVRRHAARYRRRTKDILDAGWHLCVIWVIKSYPLEITGVDKLVALAEFARANPSAPRQEQVIYGNGEPCAIGQRNFDRWADIEGSIGG